MVNICNLNLPKYRILGLDNSRFCTGWSIVEVENGVKKLIDYGTINTKKIKDQGQTLVFIENKFDEIIEKYKPNYISAEQMFVGANSRTSMTLSFIHGIMLLVAYKKKVPVTYYSIMTIKSCVLGGITVKHADGTKKTGDEMKEEVAAAVIKEFGIDKFTKPFNNDVTDSISCALTFICKDGLPIEKKVKKKKKK